MMKRRRKKNYDFVERSPASERLGAEVPAVNRKHARKAAELGEGMIAYFQSESNNCSQLLDLLETCPRHSKIHQGMIAQARLQLSRIDGMLASLGLEPNVTRH